MNTRLAVVSLWAEDVPAAAHFYRDVIGLRLLPHHHDGRPHFDLNGVYLAILRGRPRPAENPSPARFPVIAFAVEDLEAAVERLKAHHVELPWGVEEDSDSRWAMFHDPAGNLIEIAQFKLEKKLPALSGYTFRPARLEDMPALHALLVAAANADGRDRVDSLADLQTQFDDPWSDPETDSLLGFTSGGRLASFARTFAHPAPEREVRAHLWLEVHPDHRAPELIDVTFDWLEARGLERLLNSPAHLPRSLRVGVQDDVAWYIALLEQRGFQPVRYFYRMRRDLRQPIPAAPLPPGFSFERYSPELDDAMLAAFNESFRDHWGFETVIREDWEKFFTGRASFRPDLSLLVFGNSGHRPEAVGFSYNTVDKEENARLGIQEGWVGDLGVRRPWRRRGLATALLCESMRLFKAEGLDYATLGVDTKNPTGALGVYERVGFAPVRRMVAFDKPLV